MSVILRNITDRNTILNLMNISDNNIDFKCISVREDRKIVSYIIYHYTDNKTIIDYLYTDEQYRNKGYALKLINRLEIESNNNIFIAYTNKNTDHFFAKYFEKDSVNNCFILNRVKVDLHIHLGQVPSTRKTTSKEFDIQTDQVKSYIQNSNITHACILYTNYEQLYELSQDLPGVKLYGLQYYDISLCNSVLNFQKFDCDKDLWKGIKIHSHRNFNSKSIINYSQKGLLHSLFNSLPDNSIILPHFQGSIGSTPLDIQNNIIEFTNHKFIIGHSGNYGHMAYKPNIIENQYDTNKKNLMHLHLISLNSVNTAVNLANNLPNVYLDSSIFVTHKNIIFNDCVNSGFGSDFPLGVMKNKLLQNQEILYCNSFSKNIHLNTIHLNTVKFLNSSIEERMKKFFKENKKQC